MYRLIAATVLALSAPTAFAASVGDVHRLLDDMHYAVDRLNPSPADLATIENSLHANLDLLNKRTPRLLCLKSGNGRFYPSTPQTGAIIGDTDYSAGWVNADECRAALPAPGDSLSCFKRANGRFYPTNPETGAIVGSPDYNAGYTDISDCRSAIH